MKRITAIALFAVASILGAGNALAQDHEVRAVVPFDFTVGSKLVPAGNYSIIQIADNQIEIYSRDQHVAMLALTFADSNKSTNGSKLVFDKYAGQYFLSEILCSSAMNVKLPSTNQEKRARQAAEEQARIPDDSGQVMVAAK
jgi:hypothetical protein